MLVFLSQHQGKFVIQQDQHITVLHIRTRIHVWSVLRASSASNYLHRPASVFLAGSVTQDRHNAPNALQEKAAEVSTETEMA